MNTTEKKAVVSFVQQWSKKYPSSTDYYIEEREQTVVITFKFHCAFLDICYLVRGLHAKAYRVKMEYLLPSDIEITIYK